MRRTIIPRLEAWGESKSMSAPLTDWPGRIPAKLARLPPPGEAKPSKFPPPAAPPLNLLELPRLCRLLALDPRLALLALVSRLARRSPTGKVAFVVVGEDTGLWGIDAPGWNGRFGKLGIAPSSIGLRILPFGDTIFVRGVRGTRAPTVAVL